ncbi:MULTISPECIES: respiratory nitrate reductase subunit gamma [Paraburkholderia]|jgi:nitrate reductase gamma subunit|uniref:respiratory nitrate reductase subunit gamma n=1 Tax=Paraburkholderia TaxID=1822464 RepID=UPI0002719D6E|nr:respiratory nitrate reductase subunit gamma [Paraburkholderia hospita]EUC18954.1 respiratory nitrate reductase, gamma subunit [Burkholderia sp. BT03]SKC90747.1 respiratory nitrate reductase gamma subunit [Burkholderia sp. CF099]SOE90889.1 respiratory nitrate reductase gamma subunit [Burkholderia sp. YR290]AXF02502.1 respiratory nitrate reductase subunit gamma [Paraburkholderia hospita]OUL91390.1 respiratory nitrate reductase subunit gamma [Paraburkholderia hospita]
MSDYFHQFVFGIYPYICLAVLLLGSLVRFDREQYTWKSDSSQMLRHGALRLGSNLFHFGILVVVGGHFVGFLAPHWLVSPFLSASMHQLLAMVAGGAAGVVAIIGLTILIHRRLTDVRIRRNSRVSDIVIVLVLWVQLALGLGTVALSMRHMDGAMFEQLTDYVKGVVTFQPNIASLLVGVPLTYQVHIALGFTIFLIAPFTRMVHIWSGFAAIAYLIRPYQLVRKR